MLKVERAAGRRDRSDASGDLFNDRNEGRRGDEGTAERPLKVADAAMTISGRINGFPELGVLA